MRRKDREITDRQAIIKIIESCQCCRIGFQDAGGNGVAGNNGCAAVKAYYPEFEADNTNSSLVLKGRDGGNGGDGGCYKIGDRIMRKTFVFLLSLIACSLIFCAVLLASCKTDCLTEEPKNEKTDPETVTAVTASNLIVGQSTDESLLSGKFNVDGELGFSDEAYIAAVSGTVSRSWRFKPYDTEKFNEIYGTVEIEVFNYKLSFEENGGFEIADKYFNESYTLTERPVTAKNEYRFDGWALNEQSYQYIPFPYTFHTSTTLYAGYTFHTGDKLEYGGYYTYSPEYYSFETDEFINGVAATYRCYVMQNRDNLSEHDKITVPSFNDPITEPREGSIEGEVVIADMYNGAFVTDLFTFAGSGITKITFNNFITDIGSFSFSFCLNLDFDHFEIPNTVIKIGSDVFVGTALREITVPRTVKSISTAFKYAYELETVIFESDGDELMLGDIFRGCYGLKDVVLGNRVKKLYETFIYCSGLESITIPESVVEIGHSTFMWCTSLSSVVIEGNNLAYVENYAFTSCTALEEIIFPTGTKIMPLAFFNAISLKNIGITDEQIEQIAKELHEYYIGDGADFKVNVIRSEQYGGSNFSGEYVAGTEEINLYIDKFSIEALNALFHEFFHHFQYVLLYGVNNENFYSVPIYNDSYFSFGMYGNIPIYIIANTEIPALDEWNGRYDYYYEMILDYYSSRSGFFLYGNACILIDENYIQENWSNYIQLLPDKSNFEEYWNQVYERDARIFASYFTAVSYD